MKDRRVAKFEKVSIGQFSEDIKNCFPALNLTDDRIREIYDGIKMPRRATKGSAGYDFFMPLTMPMNIGDTLLIPTGLRCRIKEEYVLELYPRSSHGFKFRVRLDNTVGIIDSDYYNAKNEGHIMVKVTRFGGDGKKLDIDAGTAYCQGIFKEYFLTEDDYVEDERTGGFGSTNKK